MVILDLNHLTDLARNGRFKSSPTLVAATMSYDEDARKVDIILVDPDKGTELGMCRSDAIVEVIDALKAEFDTARVNPNIPELKKALHDAALFDPEPVLRSERKFQTRKTLTLHETEFEPS